MEDTKRGRGRPRKEMSNLNNNNNEEMGFEVFSGQGLKESFITRAWDKEREAIERARKELVKRGVSPSDAANRLTYFQKAHEEYIRNAFLPKIRSDEHKIGLTWKD